MNAWIALLRGINVGTANRVRMEDLRRLFEQVGITDAQTYIQSGNVVFTGEFESREELEALLEGAFALEFGYAVDFVVRSRSELENAIAANPYPNEADSEPSRLLVTFFKRAPAPGAEPKGVDQERLRILGLEAYVYYPVGIANSRLKLPAVGTARNWNTLQKLAEMARDVEG